MYNRPVTDTSIADIAVWYILNSENVAKNKHPNLAGTIPRAPKGVFADAARYPKRRYACVYNNGVTDKLEWC